MTDKEKLEKIVAYLMCRMYAHNQMADIGSTGEIFDEKIENAKYEECKDTLNFIDSMQEEPVSESINFEQELYKAFGHVKDFTLCMRIAKWFYDMGKNSQEPVSKDLEEAVNAYIGYPPEVDESSSTFGKRQAFKAGTQWQKEQMMKNAVDNTCMVIGKVDDHINVRIGVFEKPHEIWHCKCDTSKFKIGDKVKVIVIKED